MTISEHDASNFRYGPAFGVERSDDLIYLQITLFDTRTARQKKALFQRIADILEDSPGIRPADLFIIIYESRKENWSVGHGDMQFGPGRESHG
jgi:phenylpyruvate tautomerase PptA (4-oxalocrotonate tautomerase family)